MAHMLDLDDGCLRRIFLCLDPLPDRFSVAQACKRFHSISGSCSMWLRVQHKSASLVASGSSTSLGSRGSASTEPEREDKLHTTLQSAVAASRPGDTIVLDGGEPHCAKDVVVPWPLQIKGGGAAPEDTVLTCPKGADAALDVRASGRVANLTIHTCVGPCILHRAGHLRVEMCQLKCDARGLEHLCAPLVTVASGNSDAPCGPLRAGALTVSETRIEGGDKAVQCHGTGEVQGVRVAYHRSRPCTFWFGIDSNVPGCQQVVFGGAWGRKRHREPDTGAQQDGPKRSREVS